MDNGVSQLLPGIIYAGGGGTAWVQVGGDLNGRASGDSFGDSVSLSGDGSRVAIGASSVAPLIDGSRKSSAGQVRVFDLDDAAGAAWVQVGQDLNAHYWLANWLVAVCRCRMMVRVLWLVRGGLMGFGCLI